ncbi:MAG: hypothetical protein JNL45_15845 [Hyphomicrobium sp.]|jgi:hypothetical protein|nr:hypothetical protein [Hyphomicrobium sp.]
MANNKVWFFDTTDLAKLGRAGQLWILDALPGIVVISKEVYSELRDGIGNQGAGAAYAWLELNKSDTAHYEISDTYLTRDERAAIWGSATDAGEKSIASIVGAIRGMGILDGTAGTVLADIIFVVSDSPDSRAVTGNYFGADAVFNDYEAVGSLLLNGYISPADYFLEKCSALDHHFPAKASRATEEHLSQGRRTNGAE